MKSSRKILLLFLFFLAGKLFFSQTVRFRHLTSDNGLTQNSITCFLQDKKGFMWVGTYDGLNRYDGKNILTWKGSLTDSAAISANAIRCMYGDNEGNVWVGTLGGGVFQVNAKTGKIKNFLVENNSGISSDYVYDIKEVQPGKLFIATSEGLNILDDKTGKFTVVKKGGNAAIKLLADGIRSITIDTRGHYWFAHTGHGITEYDPVTKKNYYYSQESTERHITSNNVRCVFADSKGLIWVSLWSGGQNIIDTETGSVYHPLHKPNPYEGLNLSLISQYHEDKKGNIWFATAESGLAYYNPKTKNVRYYMHNPDDPESLSDNTVFSVTEDKSGLFWCGTRSSGVNILDPKTMKFGLYRHESNNPESIHNSTVFSFCKKSVNEMYIGTAEGVSVFNTDSNTFSRMFYNESENGSIRHNTQVYSIFRDKDESVWISSGGSGLYHYFPDKKKYINYSGQPNDLTTLSNQSVSVVLRDKKNRLWVATHGGGLNLYDEEKNNFSRDTARTDDPQALSGDNITSMLLREDGKLWIGTSGEGLDLFDPDARKVLKRYIKKPDGKPWFPDYGISCLLYDRKGNLWVGSTGGICFMNEKTGEVTSFIGLHPIFSTIVMAMEEDNSGNIWFSTTGGLCRLNPQSKEFRVFSMEDGLQGREYSLRAGFKAQGGKLFFGGVNGFNAFIPEEIRANTTPPPAAFTGLSVLNKPFETGENITSLKTLTLSYREYFFSLDLAALDYTNPEKNTFKYKLEGFNEEWVNNGASHVLTFTNLDPGEYTLFVKAVNNDGFESSEAAQLKIIITPPFWKTTWFYLLCGITLLLGIYAFIKFRERKLTKEKETLERKVEERTEELQVEKQKVEAAYEQLNEKNKEVLDSIRYAKRIQGSLFPTEKYIERNLNELNKNKS